MAFPQWLEPIVEHDVTDEDEYGNQNLADDGPEASSYSTTRRLEIGFRLLQ
jgi:hypothetical protein